jgi:hypothetical protein
MFHKGYRTPPTAGTDQFDQFDAVSVVLSYEKSARRQKALPEAIVIKEYHTKEKA